MLRIVLGFVFMCAAVPLSASAQGWDPRAEAVAERSTKVESQIEAANDVAKDFLEKTPSLQIYFDTAYGYAVFPEVKKAGIGVGGARGSGILFKDGEPQKRAYLTQYTVGLQIGLKSYSEIIFFRDRDAYDRFDYGEFAFSSNAAAVTAVWGRVEQTGFTDDAAVFVTPGNGTMLEASIGGQNFGTRELK